MLRPLVRAALALALLSGAAVLGLEQLVFFPEPGAPPPPAGVEERWIDAPDGVRLHAWWAPARSGAAPAPVLVWSHGNGGNVALRADVLLELADAGLDVLAYDYRGYGASGGRPTEAGVYRDAVAAYDSLRARGVPAARIVAFGESLGGVVSIRLARERPCAGVAVVAAFTTLADVARRHYGPLAALARGRFDARRLVAELGVPLLVAHGDRDEIVPYELGVALFAAAAEPKRFLRVAGAAHNDVFAAPELVPAIAAFARDAAAAGR